MALRAEDALSDGATVARSGKAAGAEPAFKKAVGGLGSAFQRLQDFDRHLQAGRGSHGQLLAQAGWFDVSFLFLLCSFMASLFFATKPASDMRFAIATLGQRLIRAHGLQG